MAFELPPIVKLAERLLLEIERAVRRFPRYHKYAHGTDLRQQAMKVAKLAHRAWRDRQRRSDWTSRLNFAIDDLKLSLQLCKQVEAFVSFEQFEAIARVAADLGKQCGGWQKQQQSKGQNASARDARAQRPKTLSTRTASHEVSP